jgi:undecaprenyl-diphosphatase
MTVVRDLPPVLIYLAAMVVVAGETALIFGLLVPSEATLLLVGFLAYAGTLELAPAMVLMISAALVGDSLAFRAGRRHGPRLRASGWGTRVGAERWARADAMLARLGGRGVFVGRWVAFVRTLMPRLAGSAGMPYRTFLPWNAAGVLGWVGGSVLVGFLAGESYETVSHRLGRATGAVLALLVAIVVIVLIGRWLGRNPDPVRALVSRVGRLPPLRWLSRRYGVLFFLLSMSVGPGWTLLINLVAGLALLFGMGIALAWLIDWVVRHSGLSVVDGAVAQWIAQRRTDGIADLATGAISVLRGSLLIVVVAVVACVLGWRSRAWRADLVNLVGTVGAFVPLVLLALVASSTRLDEGTTVIRGTVFPAHSAVVIAALCTLAWLLARRSRWPLAVAVWTAATVGVVSLGAARLYVGWSSASETVTSVLLGVLWTAVFMVAWSTRSRAARAAGQPAGPRIPRQAGRADRVRRLAFLPAGQFAGPPEPAAEGDRDGGHQQGPDQQRVEQHAEADDHPDLGERHQRQHTQDGEDRGEQDTGAGDHAAGDRQ